MGPSPDAPVIQAIKNLSLPRYHSDVLSNGMQLFTLPGGTEPVMKMEIVFRSGAMMEQQPGAADFMAGLLSEGTRRLKSVDMAEQIEYLGATLYTRGGVDTVRVRLLTLSRFFPALAELVTEVIDSPAFDQNELSIYTDNKVERIQIDLKKNEVLAYRHLTESIFGPSHPYGRNLFPADYQAIKREHLVDHHRHFIIPDRGMVLVSGFFGDKELEAIHKTLGAWNPTHSNGIYSHPFHPVTSKTGYFEIEGPQKHQASIRLGRRLFPQAHPDYNGLYVLNTILGGYFGSRLMNEIRENQGLTYGIYSSIDSFAADGCFYISTETATENTTKVISAIWHEADRLKTELIPDDELDMARNYLMGHLMTQLDGPFASLDFIKSMKIEGLEDASFSQLIYVIQHITPAMLRDLAVTYLNPDDWVTIVVK